MSHPTPRLAPNSTDTAAPVPVDGAGAAPASEFERMNKPREIEEWLDTYVWRRLGYYLVQLLRDTRVTPNMLSLAAVVAAFGCAWAYWYRTWTGALLGLLLMIAHSVFDAADGQLARATGRGSRHGRTIDGLADNVSFVAIYLLILGSYIAHHGHWSLWLTLAAALAGASHAVQCSLVEFERQLYWYYCHDSDLPEREHPERLREQLRSESGLGWWIVRSQLGYSIQQRLLLASSDRLQRSYQTAVRPQPGLRTEFAARYRELNRGLIGWWAWMAPNSHKIAIVLAAFVPLIWARGVLHHLGQASFFLFDIALNIPMLWLMWRQRRVDAELAAWVEESTR